MAHLFADENVPSHLVEALQELGHDVLSVNSAGLDNQRVSDRTILQVATQRRRAIISFNRRDFVRLHLQYPDHAGIIVCTQDRDIRGQAERIHRLITEAGDLDNKLLRANRPQDS